jgi:hypothetical protein
MGHHRAVAATDPDVAAAQSRDACESRVDHLRQLEYFPFLGIPAHHDRGWPQARRRVGPADGPQTAIWRGSDLRQPDATLADARRRNRGPRLAVPVLDERPPRLVVAAAQYDGAAAHRPDVVWTKDGQRDGRAVMLPRQHARRRHSLPRDAVPVHGQWTPFAARCGPPPADRPGIGRPTGNECHASGAVRPHQACSGHCLPDRTVPVQRLPAQPCPLGNRPYVVRGEGSHGHKPADVGARDDRPPVAVPMLDEAGA